MTFNSGDPGDPGPKTATEFAGGGLIPDRVDGAIRPGDQIRAQGDRAGPLPPQLAALAAHWQALRPADGALPRRADLDPGAIAGQLHCTLVLERIAPGQLRIRLAGTALCDLMGMELRGMPLSALFVPESRDGLAAALRQVFALPAILWLGLTGGDGGIGGELALWPLLGRGDVADQALAGLVVSGRPGRPPQRLGGSAWIRLVPLHRPAASPRPEGAGLAEAPAGFAPAPPPIRPVMPSGRGRPYLRLVKG